MNFIVIKTNADIPSHLTPWPPFDANNLRDPVNPVSKSVKFRTDNGPVYRPRPGRTRKLPCERSFFVGLPFSFRGFVVSVDYLNHSCKGPRPRSRRRKGSPFNPMSRQVLPYLTKRMTNCWVEPLVSYCHRALERLEVVNVEVPGFRVKVLGYGYNHASHAVTEGDSDEHGTASNSLDAKYATK